MSAADYALCDSCTGKVFYDADVDIPAGTVILHPDCMVKELAKVREDERRKAIADLRERAAMLTTGGYPNLAHPWEQAADLLESRLSAATPGEDRTDASS